MNMNALKKVTNRISKCFTQIFVPAKLHQLQYLFAAFLGSILLSGQAWSEVNGDGNLDTLFADYSQTSGQHVESGELPNGLSSSAWASIQTQITAGKYLAFQHENGGFVSSNPAHGWQIRYATDGTTTLSPRDRQAQAYQLGLTLSAVGYTEPQTLARPEQISSDDFTVTYQWNDYLREWWVNSATGLEQWFELEHRPPGAQNGQPLTLAMTLATDLAASQQGNVLSFSNDADTTISYNKLQVWDANGRELPARMQLAANQLNLIIDDADANYPLIIDPSFQQQAYIKASNTGGGDLFGFSVAHSGDTLVVGAIGEDSNATGINGDQSNNLALNSGAVYVFTLSGTVWSQQAYIKASNTGGGDEFGRSVTISGNTLVVGAHLEDSNATGINGDQDNFLANESGAVYVFVRSGTVWSQQAYIKASNTGGGDEFGQSVALSDNTLMVGAIGEDSNATGINGDQSNNLALDSGAVYVFTRSSTVWSQQAYVKASNTGGGDLFGFSVALSGNTLEVGAIGEGSNATGINGDQSNNLALNSGAVYVFIRIGTVWSQQAYIKASNTGGGDEFGRSVAVSDNTLVVGAHLEDSNATGINGDQDNFLANDSGAVYVFTRSGTVWSQQAYVKASNTDGGDEFGQSVAISGNTLVVGAHLEDSNATGINGDQDNFLAIDSGALYVLIRNGANWSQQAYVKASNTGGGDQFGGTVTLSGNTLVAGAIGEGSNATGINGDQSNNLALDSGAVYVWHISGIEDFTINAGIAGAWFNPDTTGQGQFIDVEPEEQFMFISWFTFTDAASDNPFEQQWFTAQGNYSDNTANLDLFETLGGKFDDPQMVTTTRIGEVTLSFSDCDFGHMTYSFDEGGLQGQFPLIRVISGSGNVCEELSGNTTQAVDINAGMDGAWFDPNTSGQGYFIDAHPDPEGDNIIFVSWFTYGDETASGQRWLTAQGDFEGSIAEIDVFETTGGSFDQPQPISTTKVGTMIIDFTDCSNALLTYSLPADSAEGDIAITRAIPGGQALCEELAGAE
jgi:hypothetical protein